MQTFVLAKCFDVSADGGGVILTPECGNPNPYMALYLAWYVSLDCFAADALDGLMSLAFLQCPELPVTSDFASGLSHECVLAYQCTFTRACH